MLYEAPTTFNAQEVLEQPKEEKFLKRFQRMHFQRCVLAWRPVVSSMQTPTDINIFAYREKSFRVVFVP